MVNSHHISRSLQTPILLAEDARKNSTSQPHRGPGTPVAIAGFAPHRDQPEGRTRSAAMKRLLLTAIALLQLAAAIGCNGSSTASTAGDARAARPPLTLLNVSYDPT